VRRNLITILLSIEIMLNAVNLTFVAFGRALGTADGQIIVFFVMTVAAAEAAVKLAELQLSYTRVPAPADGLVTQLTARVGALISPGQPLAQLVPTGTYLVANFKETQIDRMRAGNRAEVRIDAYPGRTFEATVESLAGGTGSRFSLLPPDNASGNFVKVVQRVPVRLGWKTLPDVPLKAGLSATVTVFVNDGTQEHSK